MRCVKDFPLSWYLILCKMVLEYAPVRVTDKSAYISETQPVFHMTCIAVTNATDISDVV